MKVLRVLSAAAVAVALQAANHASAAAASASTSLVSNFLLATGFSESCVIQALDSCTPSQMVSPQPPPPPPPPPSNTLIQEGIKLLQEVRQILRENEKPPKHCKDLLHRGDRGKGLRHIYPFLQQPQRRVTVYCDQTTDGGGWTVFQRRSNDTKRERFERTWSEYKSGFGDLEGEFWLGLDLLHELTYAQPQELRIDLADYEGGTRTAKYGYFNVGPPENKYRLSVESYSGNAGDSLAARHHGQKFSTHDADNDSYITYNCAAGERGAWWHNACADSNLNGFQHEGTYEGHLSEGIVWFHWRGYKYSLRHTTMMTRPAS